MNQRRFSRRRTILVLDGDGVFVHEIHALLSLRCTILLAASVQESEPMLGAPSLEQSGVEKPTFEELEADAANARRLGSRGGVQFRRRWLLKEAKRLAFVGPTRWTSFT